MRKCAVCGIQIKTGSFCLEHSPTGLHYTQATIKTCQCGTVLINGIWKKVNDLTATGRRIIKEHVKESPVTIQLPKLHSQSHGKEVEVEAIIRHAGNEFIVPVKIKGSTCDVCAKHGGYFEGMLQIRNSTKERTKALKKYITENPKLKIAKTVEHEKGTDYYVSNNHITSAIADKLIRRYGGILKISKKLFSKNRQTSKEVYRMTFLVILPDFEEGEVIKQENKIIQITKLAKQIKGRDLKTGKGAILNMNKKYEKLEIKKTSVVSLEPIQAMHPTTYQAEPIQNKIEAKKTGQKIKVVEDKGLYALNS